MTQERRADAERLMRVETDMSWVKDELKGQSMILGKTADDVTEVKLMLAKQDGERKAIKFMANAASWLVGVFMGLFGGSMK